MLMPREFMEYLGADFGVAGEGEGAFGEFLAAFDGSRDWEAVSGLVWRQGDEWRLNPVQRVADLKELAPRPWNIFTPHLYQEAQGSAKLPGMVPVQTRRGCPMKCIYCTTPLLEGRRFRSWEPGQVASWLAAWHERWGLTRFYFVDNLFNCPPSYAKSLCQAIIDSQPASGVGLPHQSRGPGPGTFPAHPPGRGSLRAGGQRKRLGIGVDAIG